jgi:hypothetical protein
MKANLAMLGLALLAVPALAAETQPTLVFSSAAVADRDGTAHHQIFQQRAGGRLIIEVLDPIACGQTAVHPRVSIQQDRLVLQYDLTEAPAGAAPRSCTENSVFQIANVPDGMLQVRFAGGAEPFSSKAIGP